LSPGRDHPFARSGEAYVEQSRQREKKSALLARLTVINLFFENSTRTRNSFELAGQAARRDVINMSVEGFVDEERARR